MKLEPSTAGRFAARRSVSENPARHPCQLGKRCRWSTASILDSTVRAVEFRAYFDVAWPAAMAPEAELSRRFVRLFAADSAVVGEDLMAAAAAAVFIADVEAQLP